MADNRLERIRRIRIAPKNGLRRAEVALESLSELPAAVVLEAVEQLRQLMQYLDITDLSVTPAEDSVRIES